MFGYCINQSNHISQTLEIVDKYKMMGNDGKFDITIQPMKYHQPSRNPRQVLKVEDKDFSHWMRAGLLLYSSSKQT